MGWSLSSGLTPMTLLNSRVIRIVSASVLGGILIGVVGGAFRYLLITSDNLRGSLIAWAHALAAMLVGCCPSRSAPAEPGWPAFWC